MSIFLDHASTTALRACAKVALNGALEMLGNPSGVHCQGRSTRELLEASRDELAKTCGANRSEIILNSSGTGVQMTRSANDPECRVVISSRTEHYAVIDPIQWLGKHQNAQVLLVESFANGMIDMNSLKALVNQHGQRIALISLMWVNNETGVITEVPTITKIAAEFDIPVHSDAVAAFGHVPIDFQSSGLMAMTLSGHKVGASIRGWSTCGCKKCQTHLFGSWRGTRALT